MLSEAVLAELPPRAMLLEATPPLVRIDPEAAIESWGVTFTAWVDSCGWGTVYELRVDPHAAFTIEELGRAGSRLALRVPLNLRSGRVYRCELLAGNRHGVTSSGGVRCFLPTRRTRWTMCMESGAELPRAERPGELAACPATRARNTTARVSDVDKGSY